MKNICYSLIVIGTLSVTSCEKAFLEREPSTDLEAVFETFWTLIDENYCYFDEKNVDWDALYTLNRVKISNEDTDENQLYIILAEMLDELRDGHVNLYRRNGGKYKYNYKEGYETNFDWKLLYRNYLSNNATYKLDESFRYGIIDSILYLNITGFGSIVVNGKSDLNPITIEAQFDELIAKYPYAKGLIIDVRDNGGGNTSNPDAILSRLIKESTITHYMRVKDGPGHDEFAEPYAYYVEPRLPYYNKQVVLLTNRSSYSATNYFASSMKLIPENVKLVGGKTGGGGGLPITKDLPNGWIVRLPSAQMLSIDKQQIEEGIEPDIAVDMTAEDMEKGEDTILETALALFN